MQHQLILSFLLSLAAINIASAQAKTTDSIVVTDTINKEINPKHLYVGVDFSTPVQSIFSDKQGVQAFISYQIKPKLFAVVEGGFEKNTYNEAGWNVDVDGVFGKIGANCFFTREKENPANGFYVGGRFAYSTYNQKINAYTIRDIYSNQIIGYGSKEEEKVSSYWVEIVVGGRVELTKKLYADFSVHPAVFIGGKKQDSIDPLVIPNYGRNNGPFNIPIFWGISYQLF